MRVDPTYTEEASFGTIEIGKYQEPHQNDFTTKFPARTDKKLIIPHLRNRIISRYNFKVNGTKCEDTGNPYSIVSCAKRRFTDFWSLNHETSPKIEHRSTESMMNTFFGLEQEKNWVSTPTTGGTTTLIADQAECTSPALLKITSPHASGSVMSLYDFSSPDQAFQALFGTKSHEYFCPLLDEEIDQEILITMYKQIAPKISNQLY